ncbi:PAS domain S-box protein [Rhizobium sp. BK251]|uniref:PAS domain S-box protein n=1 Tax=Rhizobium sp. BK251 TaxID=2512125 RepID=UPI001050B845|nr:PAS domain S-box protein [Rhizobium sp. BK251]TCL74889.1 PAS domain S-box-containing protein [Rhizobium sp. BK251]
MSASGRILLLEDDPDDARLIEDLLQADQLSSSIVCVQSRAEFVAALRDDDFDLILSDHSLPSFDGLSALSVALSIRPDLPFIFVSGTIGEEVAIDALKLGATDYVLKSRLSRLVPAVRRALREASDRASRQKAEDALRRREKELRDVVEAIPAIAFTTQPDGSSVWINRQWEEFSGLSLEDTSRSGWQCAIHPDDLVENAAKWRHSMTSGEPFENEARHRSAGGEYRWFLVRAVPLRDEQGKILNWYGVLTDITERKRAEEHLRVQHIVAHILAEAATIEEATPRILRAMGECLGWDVGALWRVDRLAGALRCVELWHGPSMEVPEFARASREAAFGPGLGLPGRVWSSLEAEYVPDVVPDENCPRASVAEREDLHAALAFPILLGGAALGVIEFFSREIRRPDQELLKVLATIGSQIGQFIERERAQADLRKSEQNYRMLFESIDEGFCTIEVLFDGNEKPVDYRFLQISPSFERQTGIKDAVGRRMREIAPLHEEHWFEIYGRIALTGEPMRFENEARQLGRRYDVYAFRIGDPGRRRVGILFSDITERKRAEETLRETQMELAHVSRVTTLGQMTASIAHEVAQPLAAALINANTGLRWLGSDPPDVEGAKKALGRIVQNTGLARDILDRIRALVRKSPPRQDRFDLTDAVLDVIALSRSAAQKHGVSLRTELAPDLPAVGGDRVQVQQVMLNLILNAVEAMSGLDDGAREVLVSTKTDASGQVGVVVRDTGPGLEPQAAARVFEAFYTTKPEGLGMGLSICRSIIEAHGGQLWGSPNEPRGAVFQFTLPPERDETLPAEHADRPSVA